MSKICFLINSFDIGGIERVIVTLCNGLCDSHKIDLIVLKNHGALKETVSKNINIVDFGEIKVRRIIKPLCLYLKKNAPDYIVTSIYPITVLTQIALRKSRVNTKQIVTHHALFDLENRRNFLFDFILKRVIKMTYNKAYKVFAVSVSVQRFLNEIGVRKVSVMYNPFDYEQRKKNAIVEDFAAKQYGNYLVFVGRLAKVKNVSLILHGFKEFISDPDYSDYKLLIIGNGPEKENLEIEAHELKISDSCFFLGNKSFPEGFIKNAKAVLMASFSEAMPVTVLEAFGLGVPLVTTPAQGCLDIFETVGYKFHTNSFENEREYAALIKNILTHKSEFQNLPELIEQNYGVEKIISQWNEVLL